MTHWRWTDAARVRATLAALALRDQPADAALGDIVLRHHQREAAGRLRRAVDRFGGALLADEVGLGKTYTALAAARGAQSILIVAPATLASMWRAALVRSHLEADFVSFETLSHREPQAKPFEMVIVDEAHHARNPLTRRYERLAAITRDARVLLLSATPVHNATADLHALLALFLGSRARQLGSIELASCIVRRTRDDVSIDATPGRATPVWIPVNDSPETLQAVVDIPAPCPPRDGGDGGALITLSLVRAWSSTEAALRSALRRRVARADSLADALAAGRYPTRAELRAWVVGDDATQLAFPELVAESLADDVRSLRDAVRRHADGTRRALAIVTAGGGALDDHRCAIIRDIRQRHAGERIVVFSQFADSVNALFGRLRGYGRVAAVTANGAWVAGGALSRADVLARFAPVATGAPRPARAETIDLLLATDLLSEGLNLQDASVVVHLDLPWTAARLTQRVGRVWRIGSVHASVHEYAIAPPAPADDLLRLTDVLTRKAGEASTAIGESIAPLLASVTRDVAAPITTDRARASEDLRTLLYRWRWAPEVGHGPLIAFHDASRPITFAAGVRADVEGWIAAVDDGEQVQMIAALGNAAPTTDPSAILAVARAANGPPRVTSPSRVTRVLSEIDAHLDSARAAADAGVSSIGSRAHVSAAGRIASMAAAAAPHRRVVVSRLAADARRAIDRARSAGAERLLNALVAAGARDEPAGTNAEAWLEQVIELGASAPNVHAMAPADCATVVRALLLVVP